MVRAINPRPATWHRSLLALAAVAVVAAALVGPLGAVAGAHAGVVAASPTAGEVLLESPDVVEVEFSENVNPKVGGVVVYDSDGDRVATGELRQPAGDRLVLPVDAELDDGSYIVTWRVVGEDSHTVHGTWTFQVGNASASADEVAALADNLSAGQRAGRSLGVAWGVARWTVFASIALLVGGVAFATAIWPRARDARVTRAIVWAGWVGLVASTVAGIALFAAYSQGLTLVDAVDPGVVEEILGTRFGSVWIARLVLLALAVPLLRTGFTRRSAGRARPPGWWLVAAGAVAAALVVTPALAGHASANDHRVLAVLTDALHVGAMAVWLGGLAALAAAVLPRDDDAELRPAIQRFSRVALWCVVTLVVTGAFQTWRLIGGLGALRDDEYGRILVVKLVVFVLLIVLASFSREIVGVLFRPAAAQAPEEQVPAVRGGAVDLGGRDRDPDRPLEPDERRHELRQLRRSVWAEVALGAVVLFVTALLVNVAPPVDATNGLDGATGVAIDHPQVTLDVTAVPGAAGFNDIHVNTYTPAGTPLDVTTVEMTMALPARDIAALPVPLRELGPGHFFSPGFDVPIAGTWRIDAVIRLGPVDRVDVSGEIEIR